MKRILMAMVLCLVCTLGLVSCVKDYKYKEVVEATKIVDEHFIVYHDAPDPILEVPSDAKKIISQGKHFILCRSGDYIAIVVEEDDAEYIVGEVCDVLRKHGYKNSFTIMNSILIPRK